MNSITKFIKTAIYRNFYRCKVCEAVWQDLYNQKVWEDCPYCGHEDVPPYKSKKEQS